MEWDGINITLVTWQAWNITVVYVTQCRRMKNHYLCVRAGPRDAYRDSNLYCNIQFLLTSQTESR